MSYEICAEEHLVSPYIAVSFAFALRHRSCLHECCHTHTHTGQAELISTMLRDSPALANAKTKDGVTPLMRAANKGHVKVGIIIVHSTNFSLSLGRYVKPCSQLAVQSMPKTLSMGGLHSCKPLTKGMALFLCLSSLFLFSLSFPSLYCGLVG